jgi:hypothetical protein
MLQAASDVDNLLENTTSITRSAAFHTNRGEQGDSQWLSRSASNLSD